MPGSFSDRLFPLPATLGNTSFTLGAGIFSIEEITPGANYAIVVAQTFTGSQLGHHYSLTGYEFDGTDPGSTMGQFIDDRNSSSVSVFHLTNLEMIKAFRIEGLAADKPLAIHIDFFNYRG